MRYYRMEDIKEELEREVDEQKAIAQAWRKVEFPTKKDGTEFKNFSQNFKNATIGCDVCQNEVLRVTYHADKTGWGSTSIDTYYTMNGHIRDFEKACAEKHPERIIPASGYSYAKYHYSVEEVKVLISEEITARDNIVKRLEKSLEILPEVFDKFTGMVNDAVKYLHSVSSVDYGTDRSLYYELKKYVKDNI